MEFILFLRLLDARAPSVKYIVSTRESDKKLDKLDVYSKLLNVPDIDQLDTKLFAEQAGISTAALGGMVSQMKTTRRYGRS